ncbi:MAG: hypothetical protein DI535_07350 [Citrobacter freundii]|nr:MAG: hypothetical protein DI535_07350 [Citrobacter freundii]
MSSLKDKMENYEVMPPANAWEKITAALDESHQQDQFPSRLLAMEVTPPAGAWDKIIAALDSDAEEAQYPSRLHAMEINPPSNAWNKIAASLETEEKPAAIIVNHPSRFRQVLRYAAAAVVIGAVAFGILQWTGSSDKSTTGTAIASVNTEQADKKNSVISSPTISSPDTSPSATTENNDQASRLIAKLDRPYKNSSRRITSSGVQNAVYSTSEVKRGGIYTYNDHVPSTADRYIMLMTPDGNFIRMSKKWGNLVCCVSGEDPAADCRDQLKKWQEKMATSSLTTSAGNVMDLLNIVNSLDEGTDL